MTEAQIQKGVVKYLAQMEAITKQFTFTHPANGSNKSPAQAALFKALGQRAGAPDLLIFMEGGKTLFIELKSKKGSLSDKQKDFHGVLRTLKFDVYTIAGKCVNDAIDQIIPILRMNGIRVPQ